jgi:hypothetical protein
MEIRCTWRDTVAACSRRSPSRARGSTSSWSRPSVMPMAVARHRHVANLGRVEESQDKLDRLIASLSRAAGRGPPSTAPSFQRALEVGGPWLLSALWDRLGLSRCLRGLTRSDAKLDLRDADAADGDQSPVRCRFQARRAALAGGSHRSLAWCRRSDPPAPAADDGCAGGPLRARSCRGWRAGATAARSGPEPGVLRPDQCAQPGRDHDWRTMCAPLA